LNDDEPDQEAKDDDGNRKAKKGKENDEVVIVNANAKSQDVSKKSQSTQSDYEIQRQKNIARNKELLAAIRDPEFDAIMGDLKKDGASKKKAKGAAKGAAKGEKSKPNMGEQRTSARLKALNPANG
jgi:hypothetical protein